MRSTFFLSAALLMGSATTAFAQDSYTRVIEPVPSQATTINAPIEYDSNGVAKAQYFKAEDLTPEQYQALLDEADRVRAYQGHTTASGSVSETWVGEGDDAANFGETVVYEPSQYVEIELFETEAPVEMAAPVTSTTLHTVAKGDTLYNISKRFNTTVSELQTTNGLSGTALSLGQTLVIPTVTTTVTTGLNTYVAQPIFASAPMQDGYVTRRIVEPVQPQPLAATAVTGSVYAVLPKDTLYSISRRACVTVDSLAATNGISDPGSLQPGQRLTLPTGHCLSN